MKKEVNSVLAIVLILIVSLLLIGTIIFIVNKDDLLKHKDNDITNDNKAENNVIKEEKYSKIENLDTVAKEFYDNFISSNYLLLFNYNNVFKNGNKFNVNDLSFDECMSIVYSYVYHKNYNSSEGFDNFEVSEEQFKSNYIKLFGVKDYKKQTFKSEFYYCHGNGNIADPHPEYIVKNIFMIKLNK